MGFFPLCQWCCFSFVVHLLLACLCHYLDVPPPSFVYLTSSLISFPGPAVIVHYLFKHTPFLPIAVVSYSIGIWCDVFVLLVAYYFVDVVRHLTKPTFQGSSLVEFGVPRCLEGFAVLFLFSWCSYYTAKLCASVYTQIIVSWPLGCQRMNVVLIPLVTNPHIHVIT